MLKLILTTNSYNASETLSWHFLSVVKADPSRNSLPYPHLIEFLSLSPPTHLHPGSTSKHSPSKYHFLPPLQVTQLTMASTVFDREPTAQ